MKRVIVLSIVLMFLLSCNLPSYVLINKTQGFGVDFSDGKWLLNEIEAPKNVEERLTELATKDFEAILKERFVTKNQAKSILIPKEIPLNPSKEVLKDIKKGTNFNFLINIKASKLREDFSTIDITPKALNIDRESKSELILEIYNLNTLEIIYSQKAIGSTRMLENNSDVNFSKSSRELQLGAYKKLIKELKKKSIY